MYIVHTHIAPVIRPRRQNQVLTPRRSVHTAQSQTCRSYQSCWSGSSPSNSPITCGLPICCRHFSLVSDLATPRKPPPCWSFPTSLRPSTVVMLQHWSSWTCRLHLQLSTMPYCVDVCRRLMDSVALCWSGFIPICTGCPSMFDVAYSSLPRRG